MITRKGYREKVGLRFASNETKLFNKRRDVAYDGETAMTHLFTWFHWNTNICVKYKNIYKGSLFLMRQKITLFVIKTIVFYVLFTLFFCCFSIIFILCVCFLQIFCMNSSTQIKCWKFFLFQFVPAKIIMFSFMSIFICSMNNESPL